MDCCGCDGYATPFDTGTARRDRDRYHAEGPDKTTRMLLDMLGAEDVTGATVLDIGGGIGIIDQELLRRGAGRAVLVDASPSYLAAAREEASDADLLDRWQIVAGDFVRHADSVEAADIVTLDRVVCCYRAVDELVPASAARARRLYGLVLPRDRWYVRWLTHLENVRYRLTRNAYRAYAHANARVDEHVRTAGLRQRAEAFTPFWRVVLYEREDGGRPSPVPVKE